MLTSDLLFILFLVVVLGLVGWGAYRLGQRHAARPETTPVDDYVAPPKRTWTTKTTRRVFRYADGTAQVRALTPEVQAGGDAYGQSLHDARLIEVCDEVQLH